MFKSNKSYKRVIATCLILLFVSASILMAQGTPPVKSNTKSTTGTNGPSDPPGGSGAPLDTDAIYILTAAGLLYLFYTAKKKMLAKAEELQ